MLLKLFEDIHFFSRLPLGLSYIAGTSSETEINAEKKNIEKEDLKSNDLKSYDLTEKKIDEKQKGGFGSNLLLLLVCPSKKLLDSSTKSFLLGIQTT